MKEEWQVVQKTRGSTLKQLWGRLRTGVWVPSSHFMYDGQVMPPIMGGSPGTVDEQIAVNVNDGKRYTGTDGFNALTATPFIGGSSNATYLSMHNYARWDGVTISDTIDVSYIQCYAEQNGVGSPLLKVYGVDEDDPPAPTSAAEFDADPLTTAAVDWDGAWTSDAWEESPSLNAIFQELVDTYAIADEAVMVQIKNDGGEAASNYNKTRHWDYDDHTYGPKLHIEYSAAAAGVPRQMMHYMRMRRE